ncbi:MAG: undecaprenyl-diphosphate phosphatase [Methylococcales bacterium]
MMRLIEGLTERIPAPTTEHSITTGDLLEITRETLKTFEVFIQLGAILAVCWFLPLQIIASRSGLPNEPPALRFIINLTIAVLPAAALWHPSRTCFFMSPITTSAALPIIESCSARRCLSIFGFEVRAC